MVKNNKLFIIDAYCQIYRVYYAMINSPRINSKGENTSAIIGFVNILEEILRNENPEYIAIAFDPSGGTFRHKIFKEYKAQREQTPEVIKYSIPIIKKIIESYNIPILEVEGFEADDVIGTVAKQAQKEGLNTYMVTQDKDYVQLIDQHIFMYRAKKTGGYEIIGEEEVEERYGINEPSKMIDLLALIGDNSDNIPGCKGIGPKNALKLIDQFDSIEGIIENVNTIKGSIKDKIINNQKEIVLSKNLATIRQDVSIKLNTNDLKRTKEDIIKIGQILENVEAKSLMKRINERINKHNPDSTKKEKKKSKNFENGFFGSLFEDINEEKSVKEKNGNNTKENEVKKVSIQAIDSIGNRQKVLAEIIANKIITINVIGNHEEPMRADIIGISIVYNNKGIYICYKENLQFEDEFNFLKKILENIEITKVSYNLKYIEILLKRIGIEIHGPKFDVLIAHYLLQPEIRHTLDYLVDIYIKKDKENNEEIWEVQREIEKIQTDNEIKKTLYIEKLYTILNEELKNENLEHLFFNIEMPMVDVLVEMEMNGVRIDKTTLSIISIDYTERLKKLEDEIYKLAGEEFNISSPKQVGEILFEKKKLINKAKKTKTGQYVTSEEVLQSLKNHEIVKKILEYRGLKKLLSTYIDNLPKLINEETGYIHTTYNQAVTATGRLSSSNPNLQNIPVRDDLGKEIRKSFIPDDNSEFLSADYSQIELRIMAHLSNDENMIDAFHENQDIHRSTASRIYKVPINEVTDEMRRKAKTANFGIIYGISTYGLAERLNVDRSEAKELIENYFEMYPKIKKYMEQSIEIARERGYVVTLMGRKRYIQDINSKNATVRGYAERNAINAPIQGSAADIIKVAMVNILKRIKKENLKTKLILQVHDELNFSVPIIEKEIIQNIVIEEMENAYNMSVPLKSDYGWGRNWLEAH